jgi:hypothetical protein
MGRAKLGELTPRSLLGDRIEEVRGGVDGPAVGELAFVGDPLGDRSMGRPAAVHPIPPSRSGRLVHHVLALSTPIGRRMRPKVLRIAEQLRTNVPSSRSRSAC